MPSAIRVIDDHGELVGLGDDDHSQYALLAGRTGGQALRGGIAAGDDLILESTTDATKGFVLLNPNGGKVGIGTTEPDNELTVNAGRATGSGAIDVLRISGGNMSTAGDATGLLFIQRDSEDDYGAWLRLVNTGSTPYYLNPRLDIGVQDTNTHLQTNIETKVSILGSGNVGIGTTSPEQHVHIKGSGDEIIQVETTNLNFVAGVFFKSGSDIWQIYHKDSLGYLSFYHAGPKMSLSDAGGLALGG